jgi:chromosome segregation ATPase
MRYTCKELELQLQQVNNAIETKVKQIEDFKKTVLSQPSDIEEAIKSLEEEYSNNKKAEIPDLFVAREVKRKIKILESNLQQKRDHVTTQANNLKNLRLEEQFLLSKKETLEKRIDESLNNVVQLWP